MTAYTNQYSALTWRKSSASAWMGECVEVAKYGPLVLARDSHDRSGPVLKFTMPQWRTFVQRLRSGRGNALTKPDLWRAGRPGAYRRRPAAS